MRSLVGRVPERFTGETQRVKGAVMSYRVRLARLFDVVRRDDDRVAVIRAQTNQMIPDTARKRERKRYANGKKSSFKLFFFS